jgi:hypothetical protein
MLQESVDAPPDATTVGEAVKEETVGPTPDCVDAWVLEDFVEIFPSASKASTA